MSNEASRARLCELAGERLGFALSAMPDSRIDDALKRLGAAGCELEALPALAFDSPPWQLVIGALTIGETNFFRQRAWFAQLEMQVLAPAIERRRASGPRRLRIWSAGCASGEETYSLAISALRLLRNEDDWNVSIIGTDANLAVLAEAQRGLYREWSLREVDEVTRAQHFRKLEAGRFELLPETRKRVLFEPLNLAGDELWTNPHLFDIDLIVCRNVLMYLTPERQRAIAQRLIGSLAFDGWLATSPAEATADWFRPLTPVNVPSAVLFRRTPPAAELPQTEGTANSLSPRPKPAPKPAPSALLSELSDSAAALAAARRALDSSIRRSNE